MFLTAFAAVALSAAIMGADQRSSAPELDPDTLHALSLMDRDPEDFALQQRCLPPHQQIRERVRLTDPVFAARFAWADLTGRDTSMLVAYRRSCDTVRYGQPPVPRCSGPVNVSHAALCVADEIYIVADEAHARALALRILVDEAREAGAELPQSNSDAAQALIDQSNSSR